MNNEEQCPYYGECGIVNNCNLFEDCRVKELFDDFYKVEKLYIDSQKKLQQSNQKLDKIKEIIITGNCLECDDELCKETNLTCEEIRFNKIKELIINNNGQHI